MPAQSCNNTNDTPVSTITARFDNGDEPKTCMYYQIISLEWSLSSKHLASFVIKYPLA